VEQCCALYGTRQGRVHPDSRLFNQRGYSRIMRTGLHQADASLFLHATGFVGEYQWANATLLRILFLGDDFE